MKRADRLRENKRMMASFAAGKATAAPLYCTCSSRFCSDSVVITADEALAVEQSGCRIVSLAHETVDADEVIERTIRYAAVR